MEEVPGTLTPEPGLADSPSQAPSVPSPAGVSSACFPECQCYCKKWKLRRLREFGGYGRKRKGEETTERSRRGKEEADCYIIKAWCSGYASNAYINTQCLSHNLQTGPTGSVKQPLSTRASCVRTSQPACRPPCFVMASWTAVMVKMSLLPTVVRWTRITMKE